MVLGNEGSPCLPIAPSLLSFELFPLRCMMLGSKGGETCDHCFQRVKLGPKTRRCHSASVIPMEKPQNAGIPNNELFASSGGNGSQYLPTRFKKKRGKRATLLLGTLAPLSQEMLRTGRLLLRPGVLHGGLDKVNILRVSKNHSFRGSQNQLRVKMFSLFAGGSFEQPCKG